MSYTPTNWQTGDVITAEKLNKLENGAASASGERVLWGLAMISTEEPNVDLPSDTPEAPEGFLWFPNNQYTFVNLLTQEQITLQELSALNFDNMALRDDVHEPDIDENNRSTYIPFGIQNRNTYDPENPAVDQNLGKIMLFETQNGSVLDVGWQLFLLEDDA